MFSILVIDDSAVMRNLMREFLEDLGYVVGTAQDGQEGLVKALEGDIDVCICDIHMPKLNGCQVYEELKAKKPNIRFIFIDSMPDELSQQVQDLNPSGYLKKPFDLQQLRSLLQKLHQPAKCQ